MEQHINTIKSCNNNEEIINIIMCWKNQCKSTFVFEKQIKTMIEYIQNLYHNDGISPWSDSLYDNIIEILKQEFNIDAEQIGATILSNSINVVELPYFMGSMNKFKTSKLVNQWIKKYQGPYIISAKLDGISAMYVNDQLYTRGNGTQGRNISYLIPYLKMGNLNSQSVRGELIIRKSVFEKKYKKTYSNARNLVCGLLNRQYKKEYESTYKDIEFIAYDMYNYIEHYEDKFNWLIKQQFNVVAFHNNIDKLNCEKCDSILKLWKHTSFDYEIDGIIVSNYDKHIHNNNGNPDFAFAYKNNDICVFTVWIPEV